MAYDRDSFLSGLAVGRTLWRPHNTAPTSESMFAFTIEALAEDPQYLLSATFYGQALIDWGDGTSSEVIGDGSPHWETHYYPHGGRYQITIIGGIRGIGLAYHGTYTADRLISIDTPYPKLTYPSYVTPIQNVGLSGCVNLERIPSNLMRNAKKYGYKCYSIGFQGCKKLKYLPTKLFEGVDLGTPLGEDVVSVSFSESGLEMLPSDLFSNPGFSKVVSANTMFSVCLNLKSIPDGLFDNFVNVEDFYSTFSSCVGLEYVPLDLFDNCASVQDFRMCFMSCQSITSPVPELWTMFPNANGSSCYFECVNAENYADIPSSWR